MATVFIVMPRRRWLAAAAAALFATGCAGPSLDAQWVDPQRGGFTLAGAKVLVVCEAVDLTVRRVCADQLAAQLRGSGAVPVLAADSAEIGIAAQPPSEAMFAEARAAGAVAILGAQVSPDATVVNPGPSFSIGIGGFSGGGYRSGTGGGVGVAMPVGGGSVNTGYGASAAINELATRKLLWSAKATTPPSSDVGQQLASLAATLLDAARGAGLFKP